MPSESGVITPPTVEWAFTAKSGPKKGEVRTFYQSELTIDGEVAILTLASRTITTLVERGFPLSAIGELQLPDGSIDVAKAGALLTEAAPLVPNIASESAAIMFGYYPTDETGKRAPDYDEVVAYIRDAVTMTRWLDVLNVFTDQNDWKRMSRPFVGALRKGVELGLWAERVKAGTPIPPPQT